MELGPMERLGYDNEFGKYVLDTDTGAELLPVEEEEFSCLSQESVDASQTYRTFPITDALSLAADVADELKLSAGRARTNGENNGSGSGSGSGSADIERERQREREKKNIVFEKTDIVVEKMHVHYGLKSLNPINLVRFHDKYGSDKYGSEEYGSVNSGETGNQCGTHVGRRADENGYHTILPRCFEEHAIRY